MSRIADVLDKARQERLSRSSADRRVPSAGTALRIADDVQIPWQLQDDGAADADDDFPSSPADATFVAAVPTPRVSAAAPVPVLPAPVDRAPVVPAMSAAVAGAVAAVPESPALAPTSPASVMPAMSAPAIAPAPAPLVTPSAAAVPVPATVPEPAAPLAISAPTFSAVPATPELAPEASAPAVPVAAAPVPVIPTPAERFPAAPPAVGAPSAIGERPPLLVDDETAALERKLFGTADQAGKSVRRVLVCDIDAPELSAEITVGLGLAASRERSGGVALIDLNLDGNGTLHRRLQLDGSPGVSDAVLLGLKGRRNIQRVQPSRDLWLIAPGSRPHDLRARLGQSETRRAVGSLAAAFDYAIGYVPAAARGDAIALGECFDGVVLVLDAAATPEAVSAVVDAFKAGGLPLLGTIVRNRPTA